MQRIQYKQMVSVVLASITLFLTVLLINSPCVSASEEEKRLAPLIEGAKKEGKLVVYASTNITDALPMIAKFEKKYPFIKTSYVRLSGMTILNRILSEAKANK
ncbi:hypothetical protein ACFL0M_16240, partial [Thermodesulfobacteriota bacterium]